MSLQKHPGPLTNIVNEPWFILFVFTSGHVVGAVVPTALDFLIFIFSERNSFFLVRAQRACAVSLYMNSKSDLN